MPIVVYCKQCGKKLNAPSRTIGRRGKCPQCGIPIDIPAVSETAPPAISGAPWPDSASTYGERFAQISKADEDLARTNEELAGVNEEPARAKDALVRTRREWQEFVATTDRQRTQLTQEYGQAKAMYDALKQEVALLEENLEDISFGLYKPHFNFQTSETYKVALDALRDKERLLIRTDLAARCSVSWTVGGSKKEGARMAKQNTKLFLRAFNGECDAALANVSWNNITKMEERIRKAFEALNKLGTVLQVSITSDYLELKLNELRLAYEYEEKRHQEREEQRQIRAQMREEEEAQREIEKEQEETKHEVELNQKALEKVRAEAEQATGEQLEEMNAKIQLLEAQLAEARTRGERATSRAQLTKSGHVYVLSNVGSFGERVFKVGLTRRLDPEERVKELGDASVPFPFDVHAMIYSDNAPELETKLHNFLDTKRVNVVNSRKEFFGVSLGEIEVFARNMGLTVEFTKLAEAKEYRESLSHRQQAAAQEQPDAQVERASERFFADLFADAAAGKRPPPLPGAS